MLFQIRIVRVIDSEENLWEAFSECVYILLQKPGGAMVNTGDVTRLLLHEALTAHMRYWSIVDCTNWLQLRVKVFSSAMPF